MGAEFINVTSEFPLERFPADEIMLGLSRVFGGSCYDPRHPHIVSYDGGLNVIFKSGDCRIREIRVEREYWGEHGKRTLAQLEDTLSPTGEMVFSWPVFCRGRPLQLPPFRWKDSFQLGRAPDNSHEHTTLGLSYPCLFQLKIPATKDPMVNRLRAEKAFRERFLPLLPLLAHQEGTSLEYRVENASSPEVWATYYNGEDFQSIPVRLGYDFDVEIGRDNYFEYHAPDTLQLPVFDFSARWLYAKDFCHLYAAYEGLCSDDKENFLLACEWLNKSIAAPENTEKFLFLMILLEIFLPKESSTCGSCNQPVYSVSQRFRDHIREVIGSDWVPEFEAELKKLYSLRSKVAHNGVAIAAYSSGLIPVRLTEEEQLEFSFRLVRQFLVSWLVMKSNASRQSAEAKS